MSMPPIIEGSRFAVFDTETTGLSVKKGQIIQFGLAQVDHGRPRLQASCKIRPEVPVTDGAAAIHGMSTESLRHAPTFGEISSDLVGLIGDRCMLGYNIKKFDLPLLHNEIVRAGGDLWPGMDCQPYLDVLLWERHFHPDGRHALAVAAARWGVPMQGKHDALTDCRVIWAVFTRLAVQFSDLGNLTLDEALTAQEDL